MECKSEIFVKKSEYFLASSVVVAAILYVKYFCYPLQNGFFCEDLALKYPFYSSTVSASLLYIFCLFIPTLIVAVCHFLERRQRSCTSSVELYCWNIPHWVLECYHEIGEMCFGAASCELITIISKYCTGRLRPSFMEICNPIPDCSKLIGKLKYIRPGEFTCQGKDRENLLEMRQSFPSGHASLSAYVAVYLCFYLEARLKPNKYSSLKHLTQLALLTLSWVTGLTRITDNKHHWTDVAAGFSIGAIVALANAFYVSSMFCQYKLNTNKPKTAES